ncbi:MAG: DUF4440 domain-containing protein [Gemmatimonadetes bacterium]|nr:DUF4440 domain-containing protein [Gemmatimonadota bacterium]
MRRSAIQGTLLLLVALASCARVADEGTTVDAASLDATVDSLLRASERAWNGGDLDGFLHWYAGGSETSFMRSRGPIYGWETIRDLYAPRFEPGADRDSLRFEDVATRPLGPGLGLATFRYVLFRGDSTTSNGIVTLVLAEGPEGWRIVHDHSSESPD